MHEGCWTPEPPSQVLTGLWAPQEKHAEEQAGRHGQEEVQHGPEKGEGGLGRALALVTHLPGCSPSKPLASTRRPPLPAPSPRFWLSTLLCVQGIQFLIENDLLKSTCEDIAQFLCRGEGLNKTAIGDYLGER